MKVWLSLLKKKKTKRESVCLLFFLWKFDQIYLQKHKDNPIQKTIQRFCDVCDIECSFRTARNRGSIFQHQDSSSPTQEAHETFLQNFSPSPCLKAFPAISGSRSCPSSVLSAFRLSHLFLPIFLCTCSLSLSFILSNLVFGLGKCQLFSLLAWNDILTFMLLLFLSS